jgi:hypothetical protein
MLGEHRTHNQFQLGKNYTMRWRVSTQGGSVSGRVQ